MRQIQWDRGGGIVYLLWLPNLEHLHAASLMRTRVIELIRTNEFGASCLTQWWDLYWHHSPFISHEIIYVVVTLRQFLLRRKSLETKLKLLNCFSNSITPLTLSIFVLLSSFVLKYFIRRIFRFYNFLYLLVLVVAPKISLYIDTSWDLCFQIYDSWHDFPHWNGIQQF